MQKQKRVTSSNTQALDMLACERQQRVGNENFENQKQIHIYPSYEVHVEVVTYYYYYY